MKKSPVYRVSWGVYRLAGIVLVLFILALHPTLASLSGRSGPYTLHPIYAADSSPSADLRSKLKALQDEIASKAAKLKQEINNRLQNKAYVGLVTTKDNNSFSLQVKDGLHTININQFTDFQGRNYTFRALVKDDYLVAIGDIDENGNMNAKRVIKLVKKEVVQKDILWGQVTAKNSKSFDLRTLDGRALSFSVDVDTIYKVGKDQGSWDDIKLNKALIIVSLKQDNTNKARYIYILPYSIKLKLKLATPSAQTATASANQR